MARTDHQTSSARQTRPEPRTQGGSTRVLSGASAIRQTQAETGPVLGRHTVTRDAAHVGTRLSRPRPASPQDQTPNDLFITAAVQDLIA
eukprot:15123803-Heterocapsa_arctica.AAC.1